MVVDCRELVIFSVRDGVLVADGVELALNDVEPRENAGAAGVDVIGELRLWNSEVVDAGFWTAAGFSVIFVSFDSLALFVG